MLSETAAAARLDMSVEPGEPYPEAVARLQAEAIDVANSGATLILLDDHRAAAGSRRWLDPAIATGAVDVALRSCWQPGSGVRLRRAAGIVVRSAAVRNLHDVAVLVGLGADAVAPYLLWETAAAGAGSAEAETRVGRALEALQKGIEKVISTLGIHELRGYGRLFASVGLSSPVAGVMGVHNYFGSEERGLTWDGLAEEAGRRQGILTGDAPAEVAAMPRFYPTVWKKARAAAGDAAAYPAYELAVSAAERERPTSIRHLLDLRAAAAGAGSRRGHQHPRAQPAGRDFSAMSFGSQGETAFRAYAEAAKRLNILALNGEGGEIPDMLGRYFPWRGQQVASGRFGVNAEMMNSSRLLEIKIGQGAKPGEGGHLPGKKVSEKVAAARNARPGTDLISPSNNHDLYSIEDLAELIDELKTANPWARVSVKVPSVASIGAIGVGIAKAGADIITLSGFEGGTGAARQHALRHVGLPSEIGVMEAHRAADRGRAAPPRGAVVRRRHAHRGRRRQDGLPGRQPGGLRHPGHDRRGLHRLPALPPGHVPRRHRHPDGDPPGGRGPGHPRLPAPGPRRVRGPAGVPLRGHGPGDRPADRRPGRGLHPGPGGPHRPAGPGPRPRAAGPGRPAGPAPGR